MPAFNNEIAIDSDSLWPIACERSESNLIPSVYHRRKETVERILAGLLLAPATPLLAILMFLVRLTSRGPALFSQMRVGKNGQPFLMYKIRSMRIDAEAATGPVWGLTHDPRATRVGAVLRKLHLDELPQLINVVKGDMSLIGPRPERPEFIPALSAAIPAYLDRIAVRPGITGLAQLNLPPDTDLNSVRRKLVLDREYIGKASLWLDLRLLICTAFRVLKLPETWILASFGLQRTVTLPARSDGSFGTIGDAPGYAKATPATIVLHLNRPLAGQDETDRPTSRAKHGGHPETWESRA